MSTYTVVENPTKVEKPQGLLFNKQEQEQKPTQPEQKEDLKNINIPKEDYERLLKEVQAKKEQDEQLQQLITENKTTKLNNIFKSVKDESLKKTLTDKYFNADVNQLNDFYGDITNHVFPSLVEEAKAQAEQDIKNKVIDESKGKSKAASLPKEPQVESKAASEVVPKSVNEVKKFEQLMRRGY